STLCPIQRYTRHYVDVFVESSLANLPARLPPNTALQLTASRARSLVFERLLPARSRQLNAKPLGHSSRLHSCACIAPIPGLLSSAYQSALQLQLRFVLNQHFRRSRIQSLPLIASGTTFAATISTLLTAWFYGLGYQYGWDIVGLLLGT